MIFIHRAARHLKGVGLPIAISCLAGWLSAQQPNPPAASAANAAPPAETLKIIPLEGQDQVNNIRMPAPVDLVVEVRDQNDRPLEGAKVNFQLPLTGASGAFEGGVRNKEVITNVQGQASATFTPNTEAGRLTIQVSASLGGQAGTFSIAERNATALEAAQKTGSWIGRHKKLVIVAAVAIVGGVVAAIVVTRGGSSSSSAAGTVTITPGVPTIGGPQ